MEKNLSTRKIWQIIIYRKYSYGGYTIVSCIKDNFISNFEKILTKLVLFSGTCEGGGGWAKRSCLHLQQI